MNIQKFKMLDCGPRKIWQTELTRILTRDIHKVDLGCHVNSTHVKVGDVHLGEFFEAQFLFGNAYWISIFSNSLAKDISDVISDKSEKILMIGYETYIEPVMIKTKDIMEEAKFTDVDYCIYEGPKHTTSDYMTKERLRKCSVLPLSEYDRFVFVCGISSTLSTYYKIFDRLFNDMYDKKSEQGERFGRLAEELKKECDNIYSEDEKEKILKKRIQKWILERSLFYSVIQVLPNEFLSDNAAYDLDDGKILEHQRAERLLTRTGGSEEMRIEAKYLICVYCEWQKASDCKWCYQQEYERPIIGTNETSVIPIQMIEGDLSKGKKDDQDDEKKDDAEKIDFFERDADHHFVFSEYLYYNHITRDGNHYQYYIRTNALLNRILSDERLSKKFGQYCQTIRDRLIKKDEERIDVIIAPTHYSNERFFNMISTEVFESQCEIITLNPKNEFRSNFESKYSNYSYIINPLKNLQAETNIYFHYVDDELILGNSFYRAKSFVTSLIRRLDIKVARKNIHLFESVIILLNRNSSASKYNYVSDADRFFSFIDINVPSLRNYGDSCHLCGKKAQATRLKKKSAFLSMEEHWAERERYHIIKNLEGAKEVFLKQSDDIQERHIRRFYCENQMYKRLSHEWSDPNKIYRIILDCISSELNPLKGDLQYEYIYSFIIVLSRPFLYYRENVKKAIHAILLYMLEILNKDYRIQPKSLIRLLKDINGIDHNKAFIIIQDMKDIALKSRQDEHIFYLYLILLKRICEIESNYFIKFKKIAFAFDFVEKINVTEGEKKQFKMMLRSSIIKITGGLSGYRKAVRLDNEILRSGILSSANEKDRELKEFVKSVFLDNLHVITEKKDITQKDSHPFPSSFQDIFDEITNNEKVFLIAKVSSTGERFIIDQDGRSTFQQNEKILDQSYMVDSDNDFKDGGDFFSVQVCKIGYGNLDSVYMIVNHLSQESEIDRLLLLRKLLLYRYDIAEQIKIEARSGVLYKMYQEENWVKILSEPKAISHGNSEDIIESISSLEKIYHLSSKADVPNGIYSEITLLANKLISFMHCSRVAKDMGFEYKFQSMLDITYVKDISKSGTLNPDTLKMSDSDIDFSDSSDELAPTYNQLQDFIPRFEYYLTSIRGQYQPDGNNIECDTGVLHSGQNVKKILSLAIDSTGSSWISIALIHILVQNAIEHGEKDDSVKIRFEAGENAIHLKVVNKKKPVETHHNNSRRITQLAMEHTINNRYARMDFKEDEGDPKNYVSTIYNYFMGE